MKWLEILVGCTVLGSVAFGAFMYRKQRETESLLQNGSYLDTRLQVVRDVLSEYQTDLVALQEDVEINQNQVNDLRMAAEKEQAEYDGRKGEADACQGDKKKMDDEIAVIEGENTRILEWFNGEKKQWAKEIEDLKKQLEGYSNMCSFVEKTSEEGMKMCGKIAEPAPKDAAAKEVQQ